jgi:non-canonical purine NTP pyrophosphatase (RdgB/HAM1 family)
MNIKNKEILFSTTNNRKLREAQEGCKEFGIKINQIKLDIEEIQSKDTLLIAKYKANEAFKLVNQPIVVADTSWSIPSLNGFPGGYMKDITTWFEPEDFINLLKNKKDKSISFRETIVYKDENNTKVFNDDYLGVIIDTPRGEIGDSIEKVAEFNGVTIAEKHDLNEISYDPKDYIWYKFAKWYSNY